jgi:hypothetical protein
MRRCHLCGSTWYVEKHHVFSGPYRKASERHGMTVDLCATCHRGPLGVHQDAEANRRLKREFQGIFEQTHTRQEFREIFGKSYIMEDEA